MTYRDRYRLTYDQHHAREYPNAYRDFGAPTIIFPDIRKANGLTRFILNFLQWSGHRATRINTQGQFMQEKYNGRTVSTGFRTSTTRRGTADISATIQGRSVMLEIKIGRDSASKYQLAEQARERASGGVYEFIGDPEEFILWYDEFMLTL